MVFLVTISQKMQSADQNLHNEDECVKTGHKFLVLLFRL